MELYASRFAHTTGFRVFLLSCLPRVTVASASNKLPSHNQTFPSCKLSFISHCLYAIYPGWPLQWGLGRTWCSFWCNCNNLRWHVIAIESSQCHVQLSFFQVYNNNLAIMSQGMVTAWILQSSFLQNSSALFVLCYFHAKGSILST